MGSLRTGRQLAAARVLAGLDRAGLAAAAGITTFTVRRLEQQDKISAHTRTVEALEKALADKGVRLLNDRFPGCQLSEAVL